MSAHEEIQRGERFAFGKNWRRFLASVNEQRIENAQRDICRMLETDSLKGKRFLDIGCGSGLSSLAAHRLGAEVFSFDFDPDSVGCTQELQERFGDKETPWTIEQGDALSPEYLESLGQFDIVYSWGVLHHTGRMWDAIDNASARTSPGGVLYIAIYNDQGWMSRVWRQIKKFYCWTPGLLKPLFAAAVGGVLELKSFVGNCIKLTPQRYFSIRWNYYKNRGMTRWRDIVDWVGGYPFEVAKPEELFEFCRQRGFLLRKLATAGGGLGCNTLVMWKPPENLADELPELLRCAA